MSLAQISASRPANLQISRTARGDELVDLLSD